MKILFRKELGKKNEVGISRFYIRASTVFKWGLSFLIYRHKFSKYDKEDKRINYSNCLALELQLLNFELLLRVKIN